MAGKLILIPTPIDESSNLSQTAFEWLSLAFSQKREESIFCVEDHKPGRRNWLRFGLPREAIEDFALYNEHTREQMRPKLLSEMHSGKSVYLMSDGGMPAFCDPGQVLVDACHEAGIPVTSAPVPNSIILAVALSGLPHEQFFFAGFPPAKKEQRQLALKQITLREESVVVMDTPYRLKSLVQELAQLAPQRMGFIGMDLSHDTQQLERAQLQLLARKASEWGKREFILVLAPTRSGLYY